VGDIIRLGLRLLIITLVAGIALSFTNIVTEGPIQQQIQKENDLARKSVLSNADSFEEVNLDEIKSTIQWNDSYNMIQEVYRGKSGEKNVGYTFKVLPKGYGGEIELTVGITSEGKLEGIKIGSNSETPGLGAKAVEPEFQSQYRGKTVEMELTVVKTPATKDNEVQAITGATITSKAVTDGVNAAISLFKEGLQQ